MRFLSWHVPWITLAGVAACSPGGNVNVGATPEPGLGTPVPPTPQTTPPMQAIPPAAATEPEEILALGPGRGDCPDSSLVTRIDYDIATTIHAGPTGNDATGDGSASHPYRSLRKAIEVANASNARGALVRLAAGTYDETSTLDVSVRVSIEGAGKDQTFFTAGMSDGPLLNLRSDTYPPTVGKDGRQYLRGFTIDGRNRTLRDGVSIAGRDNVLVHELRIRNVKEQAIRAVGHEHHTGNEGRPYYYSKGIELAHLELSNCSRDVDPTPHSGNSTGCVRYARLEGARFHDITISEDQGYGLKSDGGWMKSAKIYNNTISVPTHDSAWGADIAIEIDRPSDDTLVCNNTSNNWFSFTRGYRGAGTRSLVIRNNRIRFTRPDNPKEGIELFCDDAEAHNNYIENASNGFALFGWENTSNRLLIHHNVIHDTRGPTANAHGVYIATGGNSEDIHIFNNVFSRVAKGVGLAGSPSKTVKRTHVANNLFLDVPTGVASFYEGQAFQGFILENNAFYQTTRPYEHQWQGTPAVTLTERNNKTLASPAIRATGDHASTFFQPSAATSPTVDAGVPVGLPHAGSAPDIGAYEWQEAFGGLGK